MLDQVALWVGRAVVAGAGLVATAFIIYGAACLAWEYGVRRPAFAAREIRRKRNEG